MNNISTSLTSDSSCLKIDVQGRFDFNLYKDFKEAYENLPDTVSTFIVDLYGTDYIDSSALGMLLVLRESVGGEDSNIRITGCNDEIRKILSISNFQKLFEIE